MFFFTSEKNYSYNPIIKSNKFCGKFKSSYNPHIFGFISDLHITSSFYPQRISDTESILTILNESGVERVLIGGDIVENYDSKYFKYGHQTESDFISYSKIEKKYSSDFFIVASGNHDEFGIEEYQSNDHYILKYCSFYSKQNKYKKYENFYISKVYIDDIELFVLNPFIYPTTKAGIGFFMRFTTEMLDALEKVLYEPFDSKSTIRLLLTHSPFFFSNLNAKSSSHKTLIEILSSSNLTSILVGHTHHERVVHRNGTIEIQSISVKDSIFKGRGYNLISIDNNGFSYHSFNLIHERPQALLTFPIEKRLVSKMTDFSFDKFNEAEIRVVHFSENSNLNISVKCDGNFGVKTGLLHFQRVIRRNESLYSIPLNEVCPLKKFENVNEISEFRLTFSGDWNYSSEFVVGNSVTLEKEAKEKDLDVFIGIGAVGFLSWIFLVFIWSPIKPPKYCDEVNLLICNLETFSIKNILGLLFGPFAIKSRIYHNVSRKVRNAYFIICIVFLYFPMCFMNVGKNYWGYIIFYGYCLVDFQYDYWGQVLFGFFVILVLIPSTVVFSAMAQFNQILCFYPVFIIDIAFALFQIVGVFIGMLNVVHMSTDKLLSITSPLFGIAPLIIFYLEAILFRKILFKKN